MKRLVLVYVKYFKSILLFIKFFLTFHTMLVLRFCVVCNWTASWPNLSLAVCPSVYLSGRRKL